MYNRHIDILKALDWIDFNYCDRQNIVNYTIADLLIEIVLFSVGVKTSFVVV